MKRFSVTILFLFFNIISKAQAPHEFYRHWLTKTSTVVSHDADVEARARFGCYYDSLAMDSTQFYVRTYDQTIDRFTNDQPRTAYFCRMEEYTAEKFKVMISIHAGGFNEQDELCH